MNHSSNYFNVDSHYQI